MTFTVTLAPPVLCFNQEEARTAVEEAENGVLSCYGAVFEAEKAGANVSTLLSILNEAGWLLSKGKLAYNLTDFDSAITYANECQLRLNGFLDQAETLKSDAKTAGYWDYMVNLVGSGVGAVCVIVCGFAVWIFLKKREEIKR